MIEEYRDIRQDFARLGGNYSRPKQDLGNENNDPMIKQSGQIIIEKF
jgi:hypothetical protein